MGRPRKVQPADEGGLANQEAVVNATPVAPAPPALRAVKVGDVLMYLQTTAIGNVGELDTVRLPLMVTRVHNDNRTVDGIVFAAGGNVAFTGTRDVYNVKYGECPTNWQERE